MIYLGVDPGKHGAIARLEPNAPAIEVIAMPLLHPDKRPEYDLVRIRAALDTVAIARRAGADVLAVVEDLRSLPVSDGTRQFGGAFTNYARGETRGWAWMLTALGIPYQLVLPQTWQAAMLKGTPKHLDTKTRSIMAAHQRFPNVSLLAGPRSRKPSDGFADALLLAAYAQRIHAGGELFAAAEGVQASATSSETEDAFA